MGVYRLLMSSTVSPVIFGMVSAGRPRLFISLLEQSFHGPVKTYVFAFFHKIKSFGLQI